MPGLRAIMVCVDYGDILGVTLPYNRHHFNEVCIVTTDRDKLTQVVAEQYGCQVYVTDAFYEGGAKFNKWKSLEQALDVYGRRGWMCLMDADVLWPKSIEVVRAWQSQGHQLLEVHQHGSHDIIHQFVAGNLYTPRRRMLERYDLLPEVTEHESLWQQFPLHRNDAEFAGYTQVFHADDPHLSPSPWHATDWAHAGGADSFFQQLWPDAYKVRPSWEVLHIGPAGANWAGRVTPYLDGTLPQEAGERAAYLASVWSGRRGKAGMARFEHERIRHP